jgi:uncharacterized protein (TIGR02145 family)
MRSKLTVRAENFQPQLARRIIRPLLAATFGIALTFTISCSSDDSDGGNGSKGNNIAKYKTIQIGTQVWMAENLDYAVDGSKCLDNKSAHCAKYGRLYDWETAMALPGCNSRYCTSQIGAKHRGICPEGWHIPSDAEWTALTNFVGNEPGTKLKAKKGWDESGNGTDAHGFAALPGGICFPPDDFHNDGIKGQWWSSSENNASNAWNRIMNYGNASVERNSGYDKNTLFSVRCLQD